MFYQFESTLELELNDGKIIKWGPRPSGFVRQY